MSFKIYISQKPTAGILPLAPPASQDSVYIVCNMKIVSIGTKFPLVDIQSTLYKCYTYKC